VGAIESADLEVLVCFHVAVNMGSRGAAETTMMRMDRMEKVGIFIVFVFGDKGYVLGWNMESVYCCKEVEKRVSAKSSPTQMPFFFFSKFRVY